MNRTAINVREARDEEHERCRRILPECFFPGVAPELFVATGGDDAILGVAAVLWSAGGFPVQLHVLEHFRQRGIGRTLIDAVVDASRGDTDRLRNWFPVAETGISAKFLERTGFAVERRLHGFETDSVALITEARRLRSRLERSGRIPQDARIVSLNEAPAQAVAQLVAREFGAAPAFVAARLQTAAVYDPSYCVAAMHGGRVVGAVLAVREDDCLRIDVNVVVPDHRRGWTNLLLLLSIVQRGIDAGVSRFRFFCDDNTHDTLNIAQRVGARALERALLFRMSLT